MFCLFIKSKFPIVTDWKRIHHTYLCMISDNLFSVRMSAHPTNPRQRLTIQSLPTTGNNHQQHQQQLSNAKKKKNSHGNRKEQHRRRRIRRHQQMNNEKGPIDDDDVIMIEDDNENQVCWSYHRL